MLFAVDCYSQLAYPTTPNYVAAQTATPTPTPGPDEAFPNDPRFLAHVAWARAWGQTQAWKRERDAASTGQRTIYLLGEFVDCSRVDLQRACLPQFSKNFTGDPTPITDTHGTLVAGVCCSEINNGVGGAGNQAWGNNLKFIWGQVKDSHGNVQSNWLRAALQDILSLLTNHPELNLRVVSMSMSIGGDDNPTATQALWRQVAATGVLTFASSGHDGLNLDISCPPGLVPVCWAGDPSLGIVVVPAADDSGVLLSGTNFGATLPTLAGPGVNVPTVSTLGSSSQDNGDSVLQGESSAAPFVASGYARLTLPIPDPATARAWLAVNASKVGANQGKLQYGVVNLRDAFVPPALILDSVTMVPGTLSLTADNNLSADKIRRVMIVAQGFTLAPGETDSNVQVQATDSAGLTVSLAEVHVVGPVTGLPAGAPPYTQINAALPISGTVAPGTLWIQVFHNGVLCFRQQITVTP
jgi:hypothetical protein